MDMTMQAVLLAVALLLALWALAYAYTQAGRRQPRWHERFQPHLFDDIQ
jgi:hypothetical protein